MKLSTLMIIAGIVLGVAGYYAGMERLNDFDRAMTIAIFMASLPITFGLLQLDFEREKESRAAQALVVSRQEAEEAARITNIVVYSLDSETMADKTVIAVRDFEWHGHTFDEHVLAIHSALSGRLGDNTPVRWTAYRGDTWVCTGRDYRNIVAGGE